jgi:hypothetical protein
VPYCKLPWTPSATRAVAGFFLVASRGQGGQAGVQEPVEDGLLDGHDRTIAPLPVAALPQLCRNCAASNRWCVPGLRS